MILGVVGDVCGRSLNATIIDNWNTTWKVFSFQQIKEMSEQVMKMEWKFSSVAKTTTASISSFEVRTDIGTLAITLTLRKRRDNVDEHVGNGQRLIELADEKIMNQYPWNRLRSKFELNNNWLNGLVRLCDIFMVDVSCPRVLTDFIRKSRKQFLLSLCICGWLSIKFSLDTIRTHTSKRIVENTERYRSARIEILISERRLNPSKSKEIIII